MLNSRSGISVGGAATCGKTGVFLLLTGGLLFESSPRSVESAQTGNNARSEGTFVDRLVDNDLPGGASRYLEMVIVVPLLSPSGS